MIMKIQEQMEKTVKDLDLVIRAKEELEKLDEQIVCYMGREFAAADDCFEVLNQIQHELIHKLYWTISNALEQIDNEEPEAEPDQEGGDND